MPSDEKRSSHRDAPERRDTRRFGMRTGAKLAVLDHEIEGLVVDGSARGARFVAPEPVPAIAVDTTVTVHAPAEVPGRRGEIEFQARVAWTHRYNDGEQDVCVLGLELLDPDPDAE